MNDGVMLDPKDWKREERFSVVKDPDHEKSPIFTEEKKGQCPPRPFLPPGIACNCVGSIHTSLGGLE